MSHCAVALCRHLQSDHDYRNPASDFAGCMIVGCKCEDFEEEGDPRDMIAAYPTPMETIDVGAESRKLSAKLSAFDRDDSLTPFQAAIKADAERLAELNTSSRELAEHIEKLQGQCYGTVVPATLAELSDLISKHSNHKAAIESLIAVYEECAARGRTFGGVT